VSRSVPVLDVGGTHVCAALIEPDTWTVVGDVARADLDATGEADDILDAIAAAGSVIDAPVGSVWGVAVPDPFDYDAGVAQFAGVGKFDALAGVDVGAALRALLPGAAGFRFGNDGDAFALGEHLAGAGAGARRLVGITLGTGVGSGWLVDGAVVTDGPGVPPGGNVRELSVDGADLERSFSRRAIRRAYTEAGGDPAADVATIAAGASRGDAAAEAVLRHAADALGRALAPSLARFAPEVVVVGGAMAESWSLLHPWFRAGYTSVATDPPPLRVAAAGDRAPLIGAAARALSAPR
jgi:predicted NBD/HSP70 family sugar kinase